MLKPTALLLGLLTMCAAIPASSAGADTIAAKKKWNDTKHWRAVPLISQGMRDRGVRIGGEGCQWPQAIDIDSVDGSFLVFGTDVAGLWRSIDGGETWEPANVGYTPRGTNWMTIDPHFPDRVLSVGSNSFGSPWNGLYLSEDRAASWRGVRLERLCGIRDRRRQVVFDPSTRDDDMQLTRVVYWSRGVDVAPDPRGAIEEDPGLYRSDDGGRTWRRLGDQAAETAGHSILAVHPTDGRLYAANDRGVFVSDNGGEGFRRTFRDGTVTGLAVSADRPNSVWITLADRILRSDNAGESWTELTTSGLEEPLKGEHGRDVAQTPRTGVEFGGIEVHPRDADRLIIRSLADNWRWYRHVSHDGGATWHTGQADTTNVFMPRNVRQWTFAWHPTDPDTVWTYGGDYPTVSDDGGLNFRWAAEGQNAICVGGFIAVNPHHEDLMFVGSQDYNGAVTTDDGFTWTYTNVSGLSWGGFTYGAVALSPDVLAVGLADNWGAPRQLTVSRDGGATWEKTGLYWEKQDRSLPDFASDAGLVHPTDPSVAFVGRYRTDDLGRTWTPLSGANNVYAASQDGTLFGKHRDGSNVHVVVSRDKGVTWTSIGHINNSVDDIAVTPDASILYVADGHRLRKARLSSDVLRGEATVDFPIVDTPKTKTNRYRVATVTVDPNDGSRLFIGQRIDMHHADQAVMMSTDEGETWTTLTVNEPLRPGLVDGGREPTSMRVDPHDGKLWVIGSCHGVWHYVFEKENTGRETAAAR